MSMISELVAGGITGILESFTKSAQVFKADATQGAQLDAAIEQAKTQLMALAVQADARTVEAVNSAIAAEAAAKSEHWLQWAWRPLNGMVLAVGSLGTLVFVFYSAVMTMTGLHPEALSSIPGIVNSVAMVLAIPGAVCGVTAWYRGQTQLEQVKK